MWFLGLHYEGEVSSCLSSIQIWGSGMKLHWDTVETGVGTALPCPALQPFILPD